MRGWKDKAACLRCKRSYSLIACRMTDRCDSRMGNSLAREPIRLRSDRRVLILSNSSSNVGRAARCKPPEAYRPPLKASGTMRQMFRSIHLPGAWTDRMELPGELSQKRDSQTFPPREGVPSPTGRMASESDAQSVASASKELRFPVTNQSPMVMNTDHVCEVEVEKRRSPWF
jgi:hypothetical protein